ncbi:hypothetical protein [Paenibacillus rhizophilus]|uniref:Uncharacterized protein n=1 Tax=Paenibacillus rhizophilus TaxID=1850366 RepID=A0A3N9P9C9_9BACL|nr:hypothetical protein [Paenibacillus rhizophilus]RQW12255.1 hypothetical protein EH198_07825 [Paenibacillus rhizophilus]
MAITINLPDNFFTEDEYRKLKILFRSENDHEYSEAVSKIVFAALTEYKEMLLGKGLPTRADEIKQHRLFHLVKHYFQGVIPNEAEVSSMFQLTESESKALIRNVRTRFRYQLEAEIFTTLKQIIESAELRTDAYHVVIQSDNVIEELNRVISINAPHLDPISKVRGSARKYQISEDTYELLSGVFIQTDEVAAGDEDR